MPVRPSRPPRSAHADGGEVLTVAALITLVRRQLEADYEDLWVEGEISEVFRSRAGHLYFSLRDEKRDATLRAVMFISDAQRLRFDPEVGKLVRARGTATIFPPRGSFQLRVSRLVEAGAGDLRRRFQEILARLARKGLLAPERKRPIPATPRRVGLVTSRDGAALRDILKVLRDRLPVELVLAHAAVQGETAPASIVSALGRLAKAAPVEVIIVGRGGGSADDLAAWNDEAVALAVAHCPVPVIAAVGHETDVTLAELVADRRAATPSEAAMLAAPDRADLRRGLAQLRGRMTLATRVELRHQRALLDTLDSRMPEGERLLDLRRQKLDELTRRSEETVGHRLDREVRRRDRLEVRLARRHPGTDLERGRARLGRLGGRLERWAAAELEGQRARLGRDAAALEALSPLRVLGRGYALVRRADGSLVTDAATVSTGDDVAVGLARGELDCRVVGVRLKPR